MSVAPMSARIPSYISVLRISEREVCCENPFMVQRIMRRGHPYFYGYPSGHPSVDIQGDSVGQFSQGGHFETFRSSNVLFVVLTSKPFIRHQAVLSQLFFLFPSVQTWTVAICFLRDYRYVLYGCLLLPHFRLRGGPAVERIKETVSLLKQR